MCKIRRQLRLWLAILVVSGWGQAGCHDPQAPAARAHRLRQLKRTMNVFAQREADAPRRLQWTVQLAKHVERRHRANHLANRDRLANWARRDRRRWSDYQPLYRRRIAQQLAGDRDNIERSFRAMVY